jgi:hypothetical protein
MKRLGFTPQRPLYRAWQQNPTLVDHWREHEYPAIAARAKREGALIFFADESGIRPDHHAGTTWAPAGKTPVIKATGVRYGFNMLSAVSAQGQFRFMTIEGRVNAEVFREFLKRLITGVQRKVFVVVGGHPAHKAKLVRTFVQDNDAARIATTPSVHISHGKRSRAHVCRNIVLPMRGALTTWSNSRVLLAHDPSGNIARPHAE